MIRRYLKTTARTLLVLSVFMATAFAQKLPLWQVEGERNQVFLLGSIHLLRQQDYPLPAEFYAAYEEAEILVMEIDMDDIDPVASQTLATQLGLIQDNGTLAEWLGPEVYAEAQTLASAADIPLHLLDRTEPWFAAMNVEIMLLTRLGFNAELGIESHLLEKAVNDEKEVRGFETIQQQLEFLDGLSKDTQQEMFLQSLAEGLGMRESMNDMIDAWRSGNSQFLVDNMLQEMQEFPELNQAIVVDRNNDWTEQIEALLDDEDDYLIIVGTLHLVGDGGVPALLAARGHDVTQTGKSTTN